MRKTRIIIILLVLLVSLSIVTVALGAVRSAGDGKTVADGPKPPDDEGNKPDEGGSTAPEASTTVPNVSPFLKAPPEGVSPAEYAIGKIDPLLRETAQTGGDETVDVYVLTGKEADLELYGTILAKSEVDELGLVHILLRVPARLLIKVASRADVAAVASIDAKPGPEPPDPEAPGSGPVAQTLSEESIDPEQAAKAQQAHTQALQVLAPELIEPPVQPEGWFENRVNGVYNTWMMGVSGRGDSANPIRYAVIDTGVDFCNTALIGRWAVQNSPVAPQYNGWPIAYDDRSAVQFVTNYPAGGSGYGGNWGWYVNASRTVNGPPPFTFNDALYGKTYTVLVPSAGNVYRYGYHPDWIWHTLEGAPGASPVILVIASTTPGVYDKVYIDGDWDGVFGPSDVVVQKSSPVGCADWIGPAGGPDGIADDSYGLMYWMSDGINPLPGVSMLYGPTAVPPSGEVLMFMINDLSMSGGDHGTMCASSAAGIDYHGGAYPLFYDPTRKLASFYNPPVDGPIVQGPASGGPLNYGAGIVALGNFYAGGSAYNNYLFTLFGYDGTAFSDDDNAHIVSLSYGSGGEDADAWDYPSEFLDAVNLWETNHAGFHTPVWVKSAGNGGHGYGTVNTPGPTTGVVVGASTQYGPYLQWGRYEFVTNAIRAVFQDIQPWSGRGPTAMNTLAPHVSADGAWGSGAIPVNESTYYNGFDGAAAWTVWGGTSRSAPVAAGMMALIFDGWYQKNGVYPDWQTARDLMMNGALDLKYDEFSTGAGQADPYRSVLAGGGTYGVYVQPGFYTAGSFPPGSGTKFAAFGNGLLPGQSDKAAFTVINRSAGAINVSLRDEQLQLVGTVTGTVNVIPGDPNTNYGYGAPNYLVDLTPLVNAKPNADLMVVRVVEPFEHFDTLPPTPPSYNNRFRTMIYNVYDLNGNGLWWNDLNSNGRVEISPTVPGPQHELDPGDEYIRFTYSYVYNVAQEMSVHDPYERKGSGGIWLGIARATGTTPTILNFEVRFYEEMDWSAVTLNTTSLSVPAGGSATFTATISSTPHGATLLTENFDGATPPTLPAGWAVRGVVTDTGTLPNWATNAGTHHPIGQPAHSAPNLAYFNSYHATSPKSARLYRTTGLDLSSVSGAEVSFWMYHDTGYTSANDRVQVQVCTTNPCTGATANWVNVGAEIKRYDGMVGWKKHVVSLSAFTGFGFNDVKIGFLGISAYGNDVHIDDVEVYEVYPLAPGVYTGRVVVHDPGTGTYPAFDTIIPIDLQVFALVRGDPVLGGTPRAMTPYDNGYIYGATDWGGRSEAGDWRMFGLVLTQTVPGSVLMVDNVWQDYPTDIDTLILDQVLGWSFGAVSPPGGPGGPPGPYPYNWFGPYTMDDLGAGSLRTYAGARPNWKFYTNIAGYTGTQTHEFVTAPAYDGLRMLLHEEVVYGGHATAVPFTTRVATAAITPNPVDFGSGIFCTGNAITVTFKSGMNMDSLQLGGVYGWYQPQVLKNQPLYQDPPDPKLSSWKLPITLNGSYKLEVTTMAAVNIPDLDLYIVKDNNSNGNWDAGDVQVGVSAGATADEHILLKGLANGAYLVVAHGYSVSGNPGFFDILIENAQGGAVLSVTGLPTPVVAGQIYNLAATMVEPPGLGSWKAILLFGPPAANRVIEVPVYVKQGEGNKLAWSDNYLPNELITYTINLTSAPGAPVQWTLTDPIPAGTEFVNVSGATYNSGLNRVEWSGWLGSGLAPVYYENFNTVTPPALPSGWYSMTFTYTTGTLPTWLTNAGTHHPGGYPAHTPPNLVWFNSYHTSGNPGMLLYRTSGADLSAAGTAVLHFWMYHDTGYASSSDRVIVMVCANGSCTAKADWVSSSAPINRYDGTNGWKEHIVDLSAFTGPGMTDVRFGFLGISAYGNDIHIDDVALYAPIDAPNHQIILTLRALSAGYITNVADINTSPVPWAVGLFTCPVEDTVYVATPAQADFSGTPTSGIAPLNVAFTNLSTGDFTSSLWDFGDGATSTQANPAHNYATGGVYTVTLTVNGLGGTDAEVKTSYITVYTPVQANFSGTPTSGIAPLNVAFTNLSTGNFTSSLWDFGDGATSTQANPAHNYATGGVYTVTLTVNGLGGTDTEIKTSYITVYTPVQANFSGTPTSGIAPLNVAFTNLSTGDFDSSLWDFGDGATSTLANPAHNYATGGVYTVALTVNGLGGTDTEVKTSYITVYTPVQANFSGTPTSGVAPLNVTFTNLSTGNFTSSLWDFGDGAISIQANPVHNYTIPGFYTVTLTVSGPGGTDVESKVGYITVRYGIYLPVILRNSHGVAAVNQELPAWKPNNLLGANLPINLSLVQRILLMLFGSIGMVGLLRHKL